MALDQYQTITCEPVDCYESNLITTSFLIESPFPPIFPVFAKTQDNKDALIHDGILRLGSDIVLSVPFIPFFELGMQHLHSHACIESPKVASSDHRRYSANTIYLSNSKISMAHLSASQPVHCSVNAVVTLGDVPPEYITDVIYLKHTNAMQPALSLSYSKHVHSHSAGFLVGMSLGNDGVIGDKATLNPIIVNYKPRIITQALVYLFSPPNLNINTYHIDTILLSNNIALSDNAILSGDVKLVSERFCIIKSFTFDRKSESKINVFHDDTLLLSDSTPDNHLAGYLPETLIKYHENPIIRSALSLDNTYGSIRSALKEYDLNFIYLSEIDGDFQRLNGVDLLPENPLIEGLYKHEVLIKTPRSIAQWLTHKDKLGFIFGQDFSSEINLYGDTNSEVVALTDNINTTYLDAIKEIKVDLYQYETYDAVMTLSESLLGMTTLH